MWFRRITRLEKLDSSAFLFDSPATSDQHVLSPSVGAQKRKRGDEESDIENDFSRLKRIRLIEIACRLSNRKVFSCKPVSFDSAMAYVDKVKVSTITLSLVI